VKLAVPIYKYIVCSALVNSAVPIYVSCVCDRQRNIFSTNVISAPIVVAISLSGEAAFPFPPSLGSARSREGIEKGRGGNDKV
jgi:hypothetical protein